MAAERRGTRVIPKPETLPPLRVLAAWTALGVAVLSSCGGGGSGSYMRASITGAGANNKVSVFEGVPLGLFWSADAGGVGALSVVGQVPGHPQAPQLQIHIVGRPETRAYPVAAGGLEVKLAGKPGVASLVYLEFDQAPPQPRDWDASGGGTLTVERYDGRRFDATLTDIPMAPSGAGDAVGTLTISGTVVSDVKEM